VSADPAARAGGKHPLLRPGKVAWIGTVVVVLGLAAVLGVRAAASSGHPPAAGDAGGHRTAAAQRAVPGGALMLLDGRRVSLASLRDRPVMVWFVAGGCASCAASIPAVAQHLGAFTRAGTRVVVAGMYGAFSQGRAGTTALARFGKAAAGKAFASPAWTWGVASEPLTAAFNPTGTPDAYFLLDAAGHVTYRNSVPVSTMDALLAHLPARAAAGG
jgi:thiol-disulfide isomerase/thioredoxin